MQNITDPKSLIRQLQENLNTVEIFATSKAKTVIKPEVKNFIKNRTNLALNEAKS